MPGNKSKLTRQFIDDAIRLKRRGTTNADICHALGVAEGTFYAWIQGGGKTKLGNELSDALKKAESDYKTALRLKIEKQGEKDWKAYAWLLERQFPADYGRVDRLQAEFSGKTEASVKVSHYFDYGDD